MTDLEQQLTDHLRRRAAAATPHYDLDGIEQATSPSLVDLDDHRRPRRPTKRTIIGLVAVAAVAAAVIAIAVVTIPSDDSTVSTPADEPTVSTAADEPTVPTSVLTPGGGPAFAAAIEASGLLTSPSADEAAQAMDSALYKSTGPAEVSAAGDYVALRSCRDRPSSTCGTGWAYVTGRADSVDVHSGLLGEASYLGLGLLDDRYFVATENSPDGQTLSKAWLIDAVSGTAGPLRWRDEPTTMNAPEQVLLGDTVVDARDGTIRPLAVPDDVVAPSSIAQHGTGRIWVKTDPAGDGLGLAYTDDRGATWRKVALPEPLRFATEDGVEVAADDDRVAVTAGGLANGDAVYVSDDAGQSWTTATHPEVGEGNHVDLSVLADGRLVLQWYLDASPQELLASTGSDWAELDKVDGLPGLNTPLQRRRFSVNRGGIAVVPTLIEECTTLCYRGDGGPVLDTIDFSTDLKSWSTIRGPWPCLAQPAPPESAGSPDCH